MSLFRPKVDNVKYMKKFLILSTDINLIYLRNRL